MYADEQRRVYGPYQNGTGRAVFGDPLKINMTFLAELGSEINQVVAQYNGNDPVLKPLATERLIKASVKAFGLTPMDPQTSQGLVWTDILTIFSAYSAWCGKKKGNGEPTPTGSNVSDGPPQTIADAPGKAPCDEAEQASPPMTESELTRIYDSQKNAAIQVHREQGERLAKAQAAASVSRVGLASG